MVSSPKSSGSSSSDSFPRGPPFSGKKLRVAIIGAGMGGLVLAQLLQGQPGFDVKMYERAPSEAQVTQLSGFRILLASELLNELRGQLPNVVASSLDDATGLQGPEGQTMYLMDAMGKRLLAVSNKEYTHARSVSRWKLRKALLFGLDGVIQFDREYEFFKHTPDGIRIHFSGGETADCDVLIGADGAGSRVRKQLLPHTKRSACGVTVIYFKMPLTPETEKMVPFGVGGMAVPPRNSFIVSSYKDPKKPYGPFDTETIDPNASFLMCGFGCFTNEFLNQSKQPGEMSPQELKEECLARAEKWHPSFKDLVELAVPSSVFVAHIKSQDRIKAWQSGTRVTLLGDAAHSMTPYLGKGATAAISDALALAHTLKASAATDLKNLDRDLHRYEVQMLKRGFNFVKASMRVHNLVFSLGKTQRMAKWRNRGIAALDFSMRIRASEK